MSIAEKFNALTAETSAAYDAMLASATKFDGSYERAKEQFKQAMARMTDASAKIGAN